MSNFYPVNRLCLGDVCKVLLNCDLLGHFSSQPATLEHFVNIIAPIVDESLYINGPRQANEIWNQLSDVPEKLKNALTNRTKDCERIKRVLLGEEIAVNCQEKIDYMDWFQYEVACHVIYGLLHEETMLPKNEIDILKSRYSPCSRESCAEFLAEIFYTVVKRVKNNSEHPLNSDDHLSYLPLVKRIEQYVIEGKYYETYTRRIKITPIKAEKIFKITFTSDFQRRIYHEEFEDRKLRIVNEYREKEIVNRIKYKKFEINKIDYTDQANQCLSEVKSFDDESLKFPYYTEILIPDIPLNEDSENDHVLMVREATRKMPKYHFNHSLNYPSKYFKLKVWLDGPEKEDWQLIVNFRSAFHLDMKKERNCLIERSDWQAMVEVRDWCLKGSGYSVFLVPKVEKWNDWQEIESSE